MKNKNLLAILISLNLSTSLSAATDLADVAQKQPEKKTVNDQELVAAAPKKPEQAALMNADGAASAFAAPVDPDMASRPDTPPLQDASMDGKSSASAMGHPNDELGDNDNLGDPMLKAMPARGIRRPPSKRAFAPQSAEVAKSMAQEQMAPAPDVQPMAQEQVAPDPDAQPMAQEQVAPDPDAQPMAQEHAAAALPESALDSFQQALSARLAGQINTKTSAEMDTEQEKRRADELAQRMAANNAALGEAVANLHAKTSAEIDAERAQRMAEHAVQAGPTAEETAETEALGRDRAQRIEEDRAQKMAALAAQSGPTVEQAAADEAASRERAQRIEEDRAKRMADIAAQSGPAIDFNAKSSADIDAEQAARRAELAAQARPAEQTAADETASRARAQRIEEERAQRMADIAAQNGPTVEQAAEAEALGRERAKQVEEERAKKMAALAVQGGSTVDLKAGLKKREPSPVAAKVDAADKPLNPFGDRLPRSRAGSVLPPPPADTPASAQVNFRTGLNKTPPKSRDRSLAAAGGQPADALPAAASVPAGDVDKINAWAEQEFQREKNELETQIAALNGENVSALKPVARMSRMQAIKAELQPLDVKLARYNSSFAKSSILSEIKKRYPKE